MIINITSFNDVSRVVFAVFFTTILFLILAYGNEIFFFENGKYTFKKNLIELQICFFLIFLHDKGILIIFVHVLYIVNKIYVTYVLQGTTNTYN